MSTKPAAGQVVGTGFNSPTTFESDTLWNYEAGFKSSLFDRRATFNVTGFWMDLSGLQVVTSRADRISYIANASRTRSKGIEVEGSFSPNEALTFGVSGAYVDARFQEDSPPLSALEGDRVAYVPKFSGSASADWRDDIGEGINAFVNINLSYNSRMKVGYTATDRGVTQRPSAVLDTRFGVHFDSGSELTVYVRNLTDRRAETYIETGLFGPGSTDLGVHVIQPRTFGVKFSQSF